MTRPHPPPHAGHRAAIRASGFALGLLLLVLVPLASCVGPAPRRHHIESIASSATSSARGREIPLLVYLPPGYEDPDRRGERWPLVLHLHGILAEGTDPASVTREGLPRYLELGFSPPCIVVSPQLFAFTQKWTPDVVLPVLDDVVARYRVDPDRVTLLGVSSGASTGWEVLKAAPHRFAAFVPIAGWTTTGCVQRMTNVAVWGVYGGLDFVAPPFLAARGIKAHQACGGDARITVVPAMSHWVSQGVYESPALWAWILSQRRKGDASSQHGDSV